MIHLFWLMFLGVVPADGQVGPWAVRKIVGLDYPPDALSKGLEGTVRVRCDIGHNARIISCYRVSGDPGLAVAAIRNARRWQVERAASGEGTYELIYHFQIRVVERPTEESKFRFVMPTHIFVVAERPPMGHKGR